MNNFLHELQVLLQKHGASLIASESFDEFDNVINPEIHVLVGREIYVTQILNKVTLES